MSGSRAAAGETLLEGIVTGCLGAVAVAGWFLVLDSLRGRPFLTPALLGTMLLHGAGAIAAGTDAVTVAPLEIAAYTAFHIVAFLVVGLLLAWLMTLFERFPIMFFVLALLFVFLEVGFVVLSFVLHLEANQIPGWSVIVANLLAAGAMAGYQAVRHPRAFRQVDSLWAPSE